MFLTSSNLLSDSNYQSGPEKDAKEEEEEDELKKIHSLRVNNVIFNSNESVFVLLMTSGVRSKLYVLSGGPRGRRGGFEHLHNFKYSHIL